ncbi:MAG: VWA domain-containing protein [Bacteroidia bacterium]|nr:VWA domain-containing protein [Bacteroidia bacterium]
MKRLLYCLLFLFPATLLGQDTLDNDFDTPPVIFSSAREIKYPVASDELDLQDMMKVFNYKFGNNADNNAVRMEARWGAKNMNEKYGKSVLEIGLKAKDFHSLINTPPVNVSLVIDKSGSMKEESRMEQLKKAIHIFIDKLREDDILSVVVYDTEPYVLISARRVGDKAQLHKAVDKIVPEGNTNLNGGMLYGYEEVMKNMNSNQTNKVILFTDGVANIGVTKTEKIIGIARQFNKMGIDLSTIGFGKELQFSLLKKLARNGNGKAYYVKNTDDLQSVFSQEAENLISPVAKDITLEIETGENLFVREIYGYDFKQTGNGVTVYLPDFHALQSAILLAEIEKGQGKYKGKMFEVALNLSYFDVQQQKIISRPLVLELPFNSNGKENYLSDEEVRKHFLYGYIVQSVAKAARFYESGDMDKAYEILSGTDNLIREYYPVKLDAQFLPVNKILQDCLTFIKVFNKNP